MGVYEDLLRRKKIIEDEQGNVISNNVVNKDIRNQLNDNNIQTYNTEETRNSINQIKNIMKNTATKTIWEQMQDRIMSNKIIKPNNILNSFNNNLVNSINNETSNTRKNENIAQDIGGLAKLVGLGVSTGIKQVPYYIENANENIYSNYKNMRTNQFLNSPKVSELDKATVKAQNDFVLKSREDYGKGNINLNNRKKVVNEDGSVSTERSISFFDSNENKEILIPTVIDGKIVSDEEAINHYYQTGENLGKFDTVEEADKYAQELHERQELRYSKDKKIETNLVKKSIRDSINKDNQKIQEEQAKMSNVATEKLGEIAPSMGQMIPGTVLSAVDPYLGTMYFTTSASGGYIEDALNRGMNDKQAFTYGTIMGALEGASESIITGQQLSKVSKAFAGKEISKKVLESYGFNIFENAVQEAVIEPAQEITAGVVGDKADWSNMGSRMLESGFNGALMGAISNGVTYGLEKSGNVYNKIKNGENITETEYKEALQENIDKFGKDAVENAMKKGATEVYQEINNLQQQSTQNEQILPTQQVNQEQNNVAQNGNMEQILPTQNDIKEDSLKGKSFEDILDDAMSNYEYNETPSPLKDRDINTIGKETKVNAYQYDNPKVKPYFQEMAQMIGEDIGNIASADNRKTTKGGGTSLSTNTSAIEKLHKEMGYSYDQIIDGIVNIIDDHGKENNALSKKLEIIIDDQLRNGYTNSYGKYINPNQEYINLISNNNSNVTNNQLPTKEKILFTQENAIENNNKDINQVKQETFDYLKKNNINMTVDEFIEWASNKQLEQENITDAKQQELYSLINDIQNSASSIEFAKNGKSLYNIINKSISKNERAQVSSEVMTWRNNQADGIGYIDLSNKGYKSYIYNKQGGNVETLLKINGSEEFKNYIRKGVEDGTFTNTEGFIKPIDTIKNEYRRYSTNNDGLSRKKSNDRNDKLPVRQIRREESSKSTRSFKQNSGNESIKNSNESSFSIVDNQGRQLSKQQQEYFKNEAPIGLDNKGNLKVFYHKTGSNFNIIDFNKNAQGVFWFTDNKQALENGEISANGVRPGQQAEIKEFYVKMENPAGWEEYDKYTIEQLKEKGYDSVAFEDDGTIIGFVFNDSNQIKNVDNLNPTDNPDIRYELEDYSDNGAENEIQRKINRSMTMQEAKDMVQRAFTVGDIYNWYDGKYKNGDEWLAGEGIDAVAMWIDNDYQLQNKYINTNSDILNEEYMIEDVLEAYQNGTLTGSSDKLTQRLDTSKSTDYKDNRFYAPKEINTDKNLYNVANQRVTNANRNEVYKARADFILNAHNKGYIESLGLTQKEVNEKLRKWANYPKKAIDISMSINEGVARENRWTGIENSSIVNELSVSQEQLDSLVKEIKGTTNEWQRRYIANTMLAIDTHMDYSGLTYDFAPDVSTMSERALADYSSNTDTINVRRDGQNTIAHETGHFIDHLLGRKIGNGYNLGITSLCRSNAEWIRTSGRFTAEQRQFLNNFNNFLTSIENVSDTGSKYKMRSNEVFARFVARFTEWTRNTATGNRYGYEAEWYKDNFNQSQYMEFAKLLQEYSLLETTGQVSSKIDRTKSNKYDQRIEDIYSELFNNQKQILPTKETSNKASINLPTKGETINKQNIKFDNEITKTNNELKGNVDTETKVAKILTEPVEKVKEKNRTWAILKANLIDKGIVFEELSRKAKNRELQGKYDYTLTANARGQYAIGNARYDGDTQISKSLTDIIDEVGENAGDFYKYMYHQLNIDRMTLEDRYGGDTGLNYERKNKMKNKPVFGDDITAQMSKNEVADIEKKHPEFKKYAQDVYDYLDANKKELVDKGVISQETSDLFKEMYPHYVPIQRVGRNGNSINVPLDTGRTGINNPIKKAKGGSTDIAPLFETMADKTLQTYRASARNNFGVELKNTLAKVNQLNQVSDIANIDTIMENITDEQQNNELLQEGKNGNNPTFTVFENGKKVTFDISQDMYNALKPKDSSSILFKIPNKISSFHRGVLTEYNPVFSITNAIKDAQDVVLNSQHPVKTYAKFPEAYTQIIGKGHWYQEYIQNGGEQNSYFKDGQFDKPKANLPTKTKKVVTFPLKAISSINNVIEMSPRLAEYIASREKGASIETAMLDASRVTTNFKAGGDVTKFLNRNGATFLNASVQGFQQQVRNIQEANAKGLKGYAVLLTKYAIAGIPALILNGIIWKDDEDYEKLQDYVKDNYYCIAKMPNGDFIRIPKGRVSATIQKIVSNATKFVKDGKINADDVGKEFWNDLKEDVKFAIDNVAPNNPIDNNIFAPITQVINNKTWYGSDLVPSRLKKLPAEEQFDESTDKLSKWLGEKIGFSPYKINYLINQYSGGVGDVLLPIGTPQAENNVIQDKFTANPILKNKYPGQFFEKVEELNVSNNSSKANDTDKVKYKYASEIQNEISDLYKQERDIQNSSDTDKVKKDKILEIQKKINKLAENGLKDIDNIKVTGDTAQINNKEYYKATNLKNGTKEWKELSDEEKAKKKEISLKTYANYKEDIAKETIKQRKSGNIKEDGQLNDNSKIDILLSTKYTDKEKALIYENFILSKPKEDSLDTYKVIKSSNMNINEYLKYKQQEFVSDREDDGTLNGKTVKSNEEGSKKNKFVKYINSMNITGNQRLLLYAMQGYSMDSSQKKQLVNYVQNLDIDKSTKLKLYNRFSGFTTYKDGTIKY